jgi:hypothetical protein
VVLRSIRRTKPHLSLCLARCRHCGIFFPTHQRNFSRRNLGCLFGCREAHRRKSSTKRSIAYYREDPQKKNDQNNRRRGGASAQVKASAEGQDSRSPARPGALAKEEPPADAPKLNPGCSMPLCPPAVTAALPKTADAQLMEHVRVVVSLIEGRPISLEEIWEMLVRVLRQHSMPRRRKSDHTAAWLNTHPP